MTTAGGCWRPDHGDPTTDHGGRMIRRPVRMWRADDPPTRVDVAGGCAGDVVDVAGGCATAPPPLAGLFAGFFEKVVDKVFLV